VALTDGLGDATLDLIVTRLDTFEEIYSRRRLVHFSDRLRELHVIFRVTDCVFGTPGSHQFALFVDREWVAQRRLNILAEGE
jgi:hypothetical protein